MLRALGEFEIGGVKSLLGFHQALLSHPCFIEGATCHGLVESEQLAERAEEFSHRTTTLANIPDGSLSTRATLAEVDGRRVEVKVVVPEAPYRALARTRRERAAAAAGGAGSGIVVSPMQGTVLDVKVAEGDSVETGQVICIVEAMKMENEVVAPRSGTITEIAVAAGQPVTTGQAICTIGAAD
jgi:acetyl-CoA/propionyl-CoA carboxylase biotin carboxyl carrier protein